MWDDVICVEPQHGPVICEGEMALGVVILNAGPATVSAEAWFHKSGVHVSDADGRAPSIRMKLPPGTTRTLAAHMVRVSLFKDPKAGPADSGETRQYEAIAWRMHR